ncbi:MAG: hypothetical protein JSV63_03575 [Candidatus Aenigmatarchaeota archaeon]|nr:MAG: hypothetical protein JSV63_03575 [Candidatus Aenigmarchaeota archaeon]
MSAKISACLASFFVLFLFSSPAGAIDVLDESQEDITLILEQGADYDFPLLLQDVDKITNVTTEGDIDDWIGIWGDSERQIFPGLPYILVTISVPAKAELGEYDGEITADGKTLSYITVKVIPKFSDVIAHETLSDMGEEVGALGDRVFKLTEDIQELRNQIALLEHDVSEKVEEIYQYQKNLDALEKEKNALETSYQNLQTEYDETEESNRQLNELTGALVGTQLPGMFIGGILLGIVLTFVLANRQKLKRKIVKKITGRDPGDAKDFRYSYTGK